MSLLVLKVLMTFSLLHAEGTVPERLFDYTVSAGGIAVRVPSGGCTWRGSFVIEKGTVAGAPTVRFLRKWPDQCRAYLPGGVSLRFTHEELGLDPRRPFLILNELQSENP